MHGRLSPRQQIGHSAEKIAAQFLARQGIEILQRNYLRRLGEIDIVARDGDSLLIVEVRTRASDRYGSAAASITFQKRRRIVRAAQQLLQQHKNLARLRARFDVVIVSDLQSGSPRIEWIKHAFET